jgi:hypothetical protein
VIAPKLCAMHLFANLLFLAYMYFCIKYLPFFHFIPSCALQKNFRVSFRFDFSIVIGHSSLFSFVQAIKIFMCFSAL